MGCIDMNLKKIKVYGKLRQFLGQSYFEAAVKSPQQAIAFLKANFQGVEKHMNDQLYKIKMGGRVVTEDFLTMSGQGDIQIIPVATGALPAVFIGLGIGAVASATAIGTFIAGATFLSTAAAVSLVSTLGTTLILQGVTDLIAPTQPASNISQVGDTDPSIRGSYSFSGIQNVSNAGVPIPIIYGSVFTGSVIISAGSDTAQVKSTTNTQT
jgi:predicted phage tail protein